jgi:hypothetical protein
VEPSNPKAEPVRLGRTLLIAAVLFRKNSEKQRKTSGSFAVLFAAKSSETQDFRRKPEIARCKFPAKTAKTAKSLWAGPAQGATKKPGRIRLSGFFAKIRQRQRSVPLQLEDFVFDAEFLTLQVVNRVLIG